MAVSLQFLGAGGAMSEFLGSSSALVTLKSHHSLVMSIVKFFALVAGGALAIALLVVLQVAVSLQFDLGLSAEYLNGFVITSVVAVVVVAAVISANHVVSARGKTKKVASSGVGARGVMSGSGVSAGTAWMYAGCDELESKPNKALDIHSFSNQMLGHEMGVHTPSISDD
jgi:hypothetical protein